MKNAFLLFLFLVLLSCGEKAISENVLITIDGNVNEFKVSDLTNVISRKFKEKTGKTPKIFLIRNEAVYDKVLDNPKDFLIDFNTKSGDKYFFVLAIKPLFNSLKDRVEYEMCFGSLESMKDNFEFVRGAVLSPFKIIDSFDENYLKNSENLKKVFVFGRKFDKLLVLINTNSMILNEEKKAFSNSIVDFFDKITKKSFVIEFRDVSTDVLKLFKENKIFEDVFFEDANRAFVFIVSSTAKKENERNFFEGLFFGSKADFKDVIEFDAPLKMESFIKDCSIIINNYSDINDKISLYWRLNPEFSDKTYIEFKKYGDFINLSGEYLEITNIMEKGFFELEYFNENREKIFDKIYGNILEKRLNQVFYDVKNKQVAKIIFFEYISTGKVIIKAVFGPIDRSKTSFYTKELEKLGIKVSSRILKPKEFR